MSKVNENTSAIANFLIPQFFRDKSNLKVVSFSHHQYSNTLFVAIRDSTNFMNSRVQFYDLGRTNNDFRNIGSISIQDIFRQSNFYDPVNSGFDIKGVKSIERKLAQL